MNIGVRVVGRKIILLWSAVDLPHAVDPSATVVIFDWHIVHCWSPVVSLKLPISHSMQVALSLVSPTSHTEVHENMMSRM